MDETTTADHHRRRDSGMGMERNSGSNTKEQEVGKEACSILGRLAYVGDAVEKMSQGEIK